MLLGTTEKAFATQSDFVFYSYIIRDIPPTKDEAIAYEGGKKVDEFITEWLASAEHKTRIRRLFDDIIFVHARPGGTFPGFRLNLKKLDNGTKDNPDDDFYYLNRKAKCGHGQTKMVNAWWSNSKVRVCPSAISDAIQYKDKDDKDIFCARGGSRGTDAKECGCGPNLILCKPEDIQGEFQFAVRDEFGQRGLHIYENQLSWQDLLIGDFFYGNRHLYHLYLFQGGKLHIGELPTADELKAMKELPASSDEFAKRPFPETKALFAGWITSPGFLNTYNNFRSRIRGIAEKFLCQDVSPLLNTKGRTDFLNPQFKPEDLEHAKISGCEGCHYPLDNWGSVFFGWNTSGQFNTWDKEPANQVGWVFDKDISGPKELMESLIGHDWFSSCMAKRVWENITQSSWDGLPDNVKTEIKGFAKDSPHKLITGIYKSSYVKDLRKPE